MKKRKITVHSQKVKVFNEQIKSLETGESYDAYKYQYRKKQTELVKMEKHYKKGIHMMDKQVLTKQEWEFYKAADGGYSNKFIVERQAASFSEKQAKHMIEALKTFGVNTTIDEIMYGSSDAITLEDLIKERAAELKEQNLFSIRNELYQLGYRGEELEREAVKQVNALISDTIGSEVWGSK